MNDLLMQIELIQEQSDFAEYDVINSMIDTYSKAGMILENYEGEDVSSFEVFQEGDTADKIRDKFYDKNFSPIKGRSGESIGQKIIKFIPRLIMSFVRVVGAVVGVVISSLIMIIPAVAMGRSPKDVAAVGGKTISNAVKGPMIYPFNVEILIEKMEYIDSLVQAINDVLREAHTTSTEDEYIDNNARICDLFNPDEKVSILYPAFGYMDVSVLEFSKTVAREVQKVEPGGKEHDKFYKEYPIDRNLASIKQTRGINLEPNELKKYSSKIRRNLRGITKFMRNVTSNKDFNIDRDLVNDLSGYINQFKKNLEVILRFCTSVSDRVREFETKYGIQFKDKEFSF